jgi:hypothetical protein
MSPGYFTNCRRFDPGGVPGPTSKLSPRAPAQMGRRETEREGERKPEGDRRKRGNPQPSCLSRVGLEKKLEAREPARARSGSAWLGEAREPKRARAEPNSMARYTNEPSRAGSVRLASRLEARSKLLQLSPVSCQFVY